AVDDAPVGRVLRPGADDDLVAAADQRHAELPGELAEAGELVFRRMLGEAVGADDQDPRHGLPRPGRSRLLSSDAALVDGSSSEPPRAVGAWAGRLLVVVCGTAASGKSRLARELAALYGLPYLSSDVVHKELLGIPPTGRAPRDAHTDELARRT